MTTNSTHQDDQDVLREQIYSSLEKAKAHKIRLKRSSSRYFTANLTLSVLAAFLAGTAGIIGNQLGTWKITCLLASAFSIGATVTAKMQTAGQLAEASECVGQLKALRIETIPSTYDWERVSEKYQHVLSESSSIDC